MRALITVLALGMIAGCTTAGMQSVRKAEATTLPSGWRVDCRDDQAKAERTCFAGTFGKGARGTYSFFQIAYVNGQGPLLYLPNDFPGKTATVRVDNGPVLSDPAAIADAIKSGRTAYVVFYVWPKGEDRMEVDVTGYAEADRILLAKVKGHSDE